MPNWVVAKLRTRTLPNGEKMVKEEIPLGKEYTVDLDSVTKGTNYNVDTGYRFDLDIIMVNNGRYLPLDLLEFPKEISNDSNIGSK